MIRVFIGIVLLLLSLLTIFPAPTNLLWYVSILVTEFCWVFLLLAIALLISTWPAANNWYRTVALLFTVLSVILYCVPLVQAYNTSAQLKKVVTTNKLFGSVQPTTPPFSFTTMLTGYFKKTVDYKTITYDTSLSLSLDLYPSTTPGQRPCVVVVHGGSWAGGDSQQLPGLNSELAKNGYTIASINYRLAPQYLFPAPIDDLQAALRFLKANAVKFSIDTSQFVLLGRSAGGQIILSAGNLLRDKSIKGIINFYGPADMVWGYANPTNPLVLNSTKIMEDYLGGTYAKVPKQYMQSSATETATPNTVPVLSIYGNNDPLVSYHHGQRLAIKLDSVGVTHYELYLPWATHGFDWTLNGPGGQLSTWAVKQFLQKVVDKSFKY